MSTEFSRSWLPITSMIPTYRLLLLRHRLTFSTTKRYRWRALLAGRVFVTLTSNTVVLFTHKKANWQWRREFLKELIAFCSETCINCHIRQFKDDKSVIANPDTKKTKQYERASFSDSWVILSRPSSVQGFPTVKIEYGFSLFIDYSWRDC